MELVYTTIFPKKCGATKLGFPKKADVKEVAWRGVSVGVGGVEHRIFQGNPLDFPILKKKNEEVESTELRQAVAKQKISTTDFPILKNENPLIPFH